MKDCFKVFMEDMIDYAGIFPPAELSLEEAVYNYDRYRSSENSWILSHFIIPALKLVDLRPYGGELFQEQDPWRFSVLGKATDTVDEFEKEIGIISNRCLEFNKEYGNKVATELLEIKLPREVTLSSDFRLVNENLHMVAGQLKDAAVLPSRIFYEIDFEESWKKDLISVLEGISEHNSGRSAGGSYHYAGFKLRCGGTDADQFPPPEQVAFTVNRCREHDVAIKCTAGLHYPIRAYDESIGTKMHGFFNLFGGAALGYAHDLSDEEMKKILCEEDPDQFAFTDHSFSWNDISISTEEFKELRNISLISFGSCSFEEPVEYLSQLGYL